MKYITLNRVSILFLLIYLPICELGETGSWWRAAFIFCLILTAFHAGLEEGKTKQ